jgi:hypothetical protein
MRSLPIWKLKYYCVYITGTVQALLSYSVTLFVLCTVTAYITLKYKRWTGSTKCPNTYMNVLILYFIFLSPYASGVEKKDSLNSSYIMDVLHVKSYLIFQVCWRLSLSLDRSENLGIVKWRDLALPTTLDSNLGLSDEMTFHSCPLPHGREFLLWKGHSHEL